MAGASTDDLLQCVQERIRYLREEYRQAQQLDQQKLLGSNPTILDVLHLLGLLEKLSLSKEKESSSMNEKSKERRDNERYLCICDGFEVFRLDLKVYHSSQVDTNNIKPPNRPKFCPIPEMINNVSKINVIVPPFTPALCRNRPLRPMCLPHAHIVVADRIYAKDISNPYFWVCDSTSYKWEWKSYGCESYSIFYLGHVAELVTSGFGRCIGKFEQAEVSASNPPLYIVIAIGEDDNEYLEYAAAAYLVTPAGQVLCYQRLPLFFGQGQLMHMYRGGTRQGALITVDDDGKTFCAVVPGENPFSEQRFLFISTFTVEQCPYAASSLFPALWAQRKDEYNCLSLLHAVERYFVKVEVKELHVYDDMSRDSPCVTACFLSNSDQICIKPQKMINIPSFSQVMEPSVDIPTTNEWLRRQIRKRLRLLNWELKSIKSLESDNKSLSKDELHRKSVLCALIQELNNLVGLNRSTNAEHALCTIESVTNQREKGRRYLCVSYGFTIFCLDLKQESCSEFCCYDDDELLPLPIISTVKLLEEEIPVSMGFFKVNSDAYLVGGQEFHGFNNNPHSLWDLTLFDFLYRKYTLQGNSRDTYHLSLPDNLDSSLSLRECNLIGPLNKPKVWPIVEKIGDKIHVIESLPLTYYTHMEYITCKGMSSHEVLDLNDLGRGWMELPPVCPDRGQMYIWNHIVVGHRIYASPVNNQNRYFAVFDSTTNKWEPQYFKASDAVFNCPSRPHIFSRPRLINHVSQILRFGYGRCVTRSLHGDVYVLIALGFDANMDVMAEAYLVTPRGQILCFQQLPHFFHDFNRPFQATEGRVINVDEDGETMCALLDGTTDDTSEHFVFISIFTVEQVADANVVVQDLLSRTSDDDQEDYDRSKLPYAIENDFVKVVVKDVHVYYKDVDPEEEEYHHNLTGVSSACCFL